MTRLRKYLESSDIVKIVDTDYARHGIKAANFYTNRVVTCEFPDGRRMNIVQHVTPSLIPLVGERWRIVVVPNNDHYADYAFDRRID